MKRVISLFAALLFCLTLSGCGGSSLNDKSYETDAVSPGASAESTDMSISAPMTDRKLIYRATVFAETKEFDESKEKLDALIQKYGGFIESSSVSGNDYDGRKKQKSLEYTLRIPAESLFAFLEDLEETVHVLSCDTGMDDVTTTYVDTEARLTALRREEERLLALLDQAANVTEILEIENRLSEVRYEIERMTAQLKTYDDEIEYSTVTVTLNDVTDYSVRSSFGSRSYDAFLSGWSSFVNSMQGLVIGLLRLWPFLLIVLIAIIVIVLCVKRSAKKNREKFQKTFPPAPPDESQKGNE